MNDDSRNQTRRPRWGTYSTRGHLNKTALTIDLLLYDKLIFPTPREDSVSRWEKSGWRPEDQEVLLSKLGDELAYTATWEGELQERFERRHAEAKRALGVAEPGESQSDGGNANLESIAQEIAYPQTALLLAAAAIDDPMFVANEPVPPVAIAAFQTEAEAKAAYALRRVDSNGFSPDVRGELEQEFAALFTRELAIPSLDKIPLDEAFDRVVVLAKTTEYQQARRALYDWEKAVVQEQWPIDAATKKLVELSRGHDELVKQAFRDRWTQRAVCVATIVLPPTIGLAGGPVGFLGALAASGVLAIAASKAPKIRDQNVQPGAALAMAMDAVWKV